MADSLAAAAAAPIVGRRQLSVVWGPEDFGPAEPSSGLTLAGFYRKFFRPLRLEQANRRRDPKTIDQYDETVGLWVGYTGDPPLQRVDSGTCAQFEVALAGRVWKGRVISVATQRKHLTHLQAVLDFAGPQGAENRRGPGKRGFFGVDADGDPRPVPLLEKPDQPDEGAKGVLRLEEIDRWLEICELADRPILPGLKPALWWQMLIVFLYSTAMRIETALGAKWIMLKRNWLEVPPELMKGGRRRGFFWLNEPARKAIQVVRASYRFHDGRLFPWPYTAGYFQASRRRMIRRSGMAEAAHFRPHGLRKAALSWVEARNPAIAKLVANHVTNDVTLKHYTHRREIRRYLNRLPQPAWVKRYLDRIHSSAVDPQLWLF